MEYIVGSATDIGISKPTNQDSYTIKLAKAMNKKVAMCIVCDGMGGLEKGEVASAYLIDIFSNWFTRQLPSIIHSENVFDTVKNQWEKLLVQANVKLNAYGQEHRINLGSTVTGILLIDNKYLIVNVGDSRTYQLKDRVVQVTEDQSLIAREVKLGRLTPEQALNDPRRNVLLQCVGAVPNIEVEFYTGIAEAGEEFLLCTDGFRHMISEDEMYNALNPKDMNSEEVITDRIKKLIKINMERAESDNITAVMIKLI